MRKRTKNSTNAGTLRYSNFGTSGLFQDLGTGGDYSDIDSHQTYHADGTPASGSDWTAEDTTKTIGTVSSLIQNVVNAIFGRSDQYRADALNQMYTQEKRSNTILWVVIGLVLALGVFLVVRKTK